MEKEFQRDCRNLITELSNSPTNLLSPLELLLWVYLNIYLYPKSCNEGIYTGQMFIDCLNKEDNFIDFLPIYKDLEEESYSLLKERILDIYPRNTIDLKEMEILYEGLLLEGVRSKTGTYYTPQPIVHYMVVNALITYINNRIEDIPNEWENFILFQEGSLEKSLAIKLSNILKEIKIIDLACGGGIFLREALRVIFKLQAKLKEALGVGVDEHQLLGELLKNIYGVDIQPKTVLLCKLLLLMEYENLGGRKSNGVDLKIRCKNALISGEDDGEKQWGSFDIVLGNPPYIGERGNRQIFEEIKNTTFGQRYYEGKMDYFYFFIHRGGEILKKGGVFGFITTNYFVTADGASKLRSFMREYFSFKELINFNEAKVFKDAVGQHNMIFIGLKESKSLVEPRIITLLDKKLSGDEVMRQLLHKENVAGVKINTLKSQDDLYDDKGQMLLQSSYGGTDLLNRISRRFKYTLEDFCHVNQGIVSGADCLTSTGAEKLGIEEDVGKGIFVLTEEEVKEKGFHQFPYCNYLKDFYKNRHIKRYRLLNNQGLKILYLDDEVPEDIEKLSAIYQHLKKYKPLLMERREVKKGSRKWYALQWPRKREIFEGEKLVVPQRALENSFAFHKGPWYASADVYYITPKDTNVSLKTILGVLNSSFIYFWLFHRGKRKGEYLELYGTPLKAIPFPTIIELSVLTDLENIVEEIESRIEDNIENNLENKVVDHIENNLKQFQEIKALQKEINEIVFNVYGLEEGEKEIIRNFMKERRE